jgi:predicted PolB exonuclease-like 3'-5' exonuclease
MKTTFNFTDLEKQVIRNFFYTGKINLDFLADHVHTVHSICALILTNEGKFVQLDTLKGVIGSLVKKNILESDDAEGNGFNYIYPSYDFDWTKESFNEIMSIVK